MVWGITSTDAKEGHEICVFIVEKNVYKMKYKLHSLTYTSNPVNRAKFYK